MSTAAENLATHIRWAEAENTQDVTVERWLEFCHEDIVIEHLDGGTVRGIETMVDNLKDSIKAMPDWQNVIEDRFATEDRVVCRWRITGVPTEEGGPAEVRGTSVWEFEDGRAKRGFICSNAEYMKQQGIQQAGSFSIHAHDGSLTDA